MTTKERVITESLARLKKQHTDLMQMWDAKPLVELCELRQKAAAKMDFYKSGTPEALKELSELAKEEKRLFALAEKQQTMTLKLPEMRVKIEMEMRDLENELFYINQRRQK